MTVEDMITQLSMTVRSGIELFHRIVNPYIVKREADARLYSAQRDLEIERLKAANFDATMRRLPDMLHEGSEIHEDLDTTWFLNFHDIVCRISDDEIQNIFAAIMAGELENPGGCSVRTMRVIADLSREEAELFRKATGCVIRLDNRWVLPKQDDADEINPLRYQDHLVLEDCGLLQTSGVNRYYREFDGEFTQINYQDRLLGVVSPKETGEGLTIRVDGISLLTRAGAELYGILRRYGSAAADDGFFVGYVNRLAETKPELDIRLYTCRRKDDGTLTTTSPDMIGKSLDEVRRFLRCGSGRRTRTCPTQEWVRRPGGLGPKSNSNPMRRRSLAVPMTWSSWSMCT